MTVSVREWIKSRTSGCAFAEVSRVPYMFNNIVPDNLSIIITLQFWTSRGDRMWGTGTLVDSANHFRRWASIPNFWIPSLKSAPFFHRIVLAMTLDLSSKPTSSVLWDREIRLQSLSKLITCQVDIFATNRWFNWWFMKDMGDIVY